MEKNVRRTATAEPGLFGPGQDPTKLAPAKPAPKPKPVAKTKATAKTKAAPGTHVAVRQPPQAPVAPKSLLELIWEAARDPSIDVGKMRELLDIKRQEEARISEREFSVAMLDAQAEMPRIVKDRWNPHTKSRYPRLDSVSKQVDPIARKHGFVLSYGMSESPMDGHYRIICDVAHKGGHTKRYYADIGSDTQGAKGGGTKSSAQGSGSSIAYGRRYLKFMIFDLIAVEEDTDGTNIQKITDAQAEQLLRLCSERGINREQFSAAFLVDEIADLPAYKFDNAVMRISQKAVARKKGPHDDEVSAGR